MYFFGIDDLLKLIIRDTKALDEAINQSRMGGQGGMMGMGMPGQSPPGGTDFKKVFAGEAQNYEIMNWKFELDDVEDALIAKYRN